MPESPASAVFIFTDLEDSTQLWEEHPRAMSRALARHDDLLRRTLERHGGRVFKSVGDGFCAVFESADRAVAAAVEAQRRLSREAWEGLAPLRARMALHAGPAERRSHDYFGPTLNRTARILAAGHGGQVLLSAAVERLARPGLPADVALRDCGEVQLKDLSRPERLFQLVIVGLPAEFPPLDTLDLRPHNLPAQATPLLGRERELAAAQELLLRTSVRLVTLTGPAGTGKTRLAVQLGAETIPHFGSGVFFVPLASTREPALVASTVAQTLGLRQFDERSPLESLKEHLRTKPMLLVLDNFEHVLQAAPQVAELLLAAPALKILVTSRAPLRLLGEHEFPVPPLAVPTAEGPLDPAEIQGFPAVDLFVLRAQAVQPDFRLTGANAGSVVDVCRRLDGLPLAIELAATRVKLMSPAAMLPRLERRLEFLRGGRRDMPERHQTLRGAIGWSYDLLRPPDQALFRRLCTLSGAFSLELARDLHDAPPRLDLDGVEGIATLVDESLVQRGDAVDEQPRFVVLETIREYGLEQLSRAGEEPPLRAWLARHFVHLAELAAPALTGPDQAAWLDRLERAHANLRSALDWCASPAATADDAATGVRLAGALWRFWMVHGYVNEGREWIERMLACAPHAPPEQRARALLGAATWRRPRATWSAPWTMGSGAWRSTPSWATPVAGRAP